MKLHEEWRAVREVAQAAVNDVMSLSATTVDLRVGPTEGAPAIQTRIDLLGDVRTIVFGERPSEHLLALHSIAIDTASRVHRDRIQGAIEILSAAL